MRGPLPAHLTNLELIAPVPAEVEIVTDISIKVAIWCPTGCDLRGGLVKVMASGDTLAIHELTAHDELQGTNQTDEFMITAPAQVGEHEWKILFPRQHAGGHLHEESAQPVVFCTRPKRTSLAIWAVPSPVVMGRPFSIKIGAKSSGACELAGAKVEILDQHGIPVGGGRLGDRSWPGSTALYWTDVDLVAPMSEGITSWSARFPATEIALAHSAASGQFSFATVRPPEHRLTVKVVEKGTGKPIGNAKVRVGSFLCITDGEGLAQVDLPRGNYKLALWKSGFGAPPQMLDVSGNTVIEVELVPLPKEERNGRWM